MKKDIKKELKKECEKLFKEIVCKRANGHCEACESTFGVTAHHYIPRSLAGHMIYDLNNGICLCRNCHFAVHRKSDPSIIHIIYVRRGEKWLDYISAKRKETHRSFKTKQWYLKTLEELKRSEKII
jgi:5-methylcytosine-specific restriction endonuclease McrA